MKIIIEPRKQDIKHYAMLGVILGYKSIDWDENTSDVIQSLWKWLDTTVSSLDSLPDLEYLETALNDVLSDIAVAKKICGG